MKHKAMYEHEVEKPAMPSEGHLDRSMGLGEFKGDADPIAYGQASREGCKKDMGKIKGQFKDYHWD